MRARIVSCSPFRTVSNGSGPSTLPLVLTCSIRVPLASGVEAVNAIVSAAESESVGERNATPNSPPESAEPSTDRSKEISTAATCLLETVEKAKREQHFRLTVERSAELWRHRQGLACVAGWERHDELVRKRPLVKLGVLRNGTADLSTAHKHFHDCVTIRHTQTRVRSKEVCSYECACGVVE